MVPDFLLPRGASGASGCEELAELKVLSCCPSHYSPTAGTKAVDVRAQAVPGEYARKARTADQRYLGVLPGEVGPVEKKLQEFPLSVYVFGAFGEASEDVHALVKTVAEARVKSSGLGLGKGGRELKWEGAVGVATGLVRRRLFTVAVREQARLLLDRVPFSGASGLAALQRREEALREEDCGFQREWRADRAADRRAFPSFPREDAEAGG